MAQDQPDMTFDESVAQVMQTLPPVVRAYIVQKKYTAAARSLMSEYNLRIDQGAVLERKILLLLMGIDDPNEFVHALATEARLDKTTIDNIARDVNNQIFIPLRAEEMKEGAAPAADAAAPEPASHFHLQNKILPPPRPPQARPLAVPSRGEKLLEDHEEPHIEFHAQKAPPAAPRPFAADIPPNLPGQPQAARPAPPAAPATPVQPRVIAPGARASVPTPSSAPTSVPTNAPPASPVPPMPQKSTPPAPPTPPAEGYSADPYREPIDEEEGGR